MADPVGNVTLLERLEANRMLLKYSANGDTHELRSVLAEGKANIDVQNNYYGYTGLILASRHGHVECLKLLLRANANVNIQNKLGDTGLIFASRNGDVECLKLLLAANANVNIQNEDGDTGLIFASRNGDVECLKLLLAANANVDSQDEDGDTGLILASMNGHVECLKLLLAANANVDSHNVMGNTGLILASRYGDVECLKILLENNVNVNHQNLDNKSALTSCCTGYLAHDYNKPVIQFLLLSCGAEGEGKESLAEMNTRITEYHTELMDVLSEEVVVDTRLYLEEHGLYHEPLERVMQYCGLELMLENDPNRHEADVIPVLLRGTKQRVNSALYWWNLFHFI